MVCADSKKLNFKKWRSRLILSALILFDGFGFIVAGEVLYLEAEKTFFSHKKSDETQTESQKRLKAEDGFWDQYQDVDGKGDSDSCDRFPEIQNGGTVKKALPTLKEFALKGDKIALCQLGLIYMQGLGGVEKNKKAGMAYWLKAAEAGDAQAQFSLGMVYDYGNHLTARDPKKAFYWYSQSAAQGHFKGGFNLACIEQNSASPKVREKGNTALKQFSDQGEPWAGFRLGEYYIGRGADLESPASKERKGEDWQQAAFYYQRAVDGGNEASMYMLGAMYALGHGVPVDISKRNDLWQKAAAQKEERAQRMLGKSYLEGDGLPQDNKKGIMFLRQAAENGDAESAMLLANMYHEGVVFPQEDAKALAYWQIALDKGDEHARKFIVRAYQEGTGVPKDDQKAEALLTEGLEKGSPDIEYAYGSSMLEAAESPEEEADAAQWIKKAAQQNNFFAEQKLADLYARGQGVPQNPEAAEKWQQKADKILKEAAKEGSVSALKDLASGNLKENPKKAMKDYRKAAKQGDAEAQYMLGVLYFRGQGLRRNPRMAAVWWKKAADQKNLPALKALGGIYLSGVFTPDAAQTDPQKSRTGVKRNPKTAAKYYKQAADLGDAEAQNVLGELYSRGQGVRKDWKEAVKYWQKAAAQENAAAQLSLSMAYKTGKGVKADLEQSDYWAQKAASGGKVSA
ncbi:sel1 repeat family protein [Acetobacteraceae bacterium]|nr:sel1 repeat family protein [Acetobacteraceae bacterium]